MRIWDIPTKKLCRNHLLGEHNELHAIWSILNNRNKGFYNHPETLRWKGKLKALYLRHEQQVKEMEKREYNHKSPLDQTLATGDSIQKDFVNSVKDQNRILKNKGCDCDI
jgi:hypothetical protein